MAVVEVENKTKDPVTGKPNVVRLTIDEDTPDGAERLAYLHTLVRRNDLERVTVVKEPATRKAAAK
ncbi:hypothetical protein [Streptomyces sp. NPDC005166]